MKEKQNERPQCVAWFKLAEFIARGEKERAIGIYKLIVLAFNDAAFSLQLNADLLYSFNDNTGAIEKYKEAAILYLSNNRFIEAATVYESLSTIAPDNLEYLEMLTELYKQLSCNTKLEDALIRLFDLKIKNHDIFKCKEILNDIKKLSDKKLPLLYEKIVFLMIDVNHNLKEIDKYTKLALNGYFDQNSPQLQKFLSKLKALSKDSYQQAVQFLEKEG